MKKAARNGQIQQFLINIRSSFWFLPALLVVAASASAFILVEVDHGLDQELRELWPRQLATEADGARAMLSTIAGSMATVAGVVFSITVVALTLASSQYSSRVLRNFMRDRLTQLVLGVFLGVYIYCLLVLRTISGGDEAFVPSLAVLGSVVLAIVAVGFFIFFIHHISITIQASEIAISITHETIDAIDAIFPDSVGPTEDFAFTAPLAPAKWHEIPSSALGYIQTIDEDGLVEIARGRETLLRMEAQIGEFVSTGKPLASVLINEPPDDAMIRAVNERYAIGSYRTIGEDPAFGFRQLVDIAMKALSPSINDTTTAVICIEHISALLERCGRLQMGLCCHYLEGHKRLIKLRPNYEQLVSLSFTQILENAAGNSEILVRVLVSLGHIAAVAAGPGRIASIRVQAQSVEKLAQESAKSSAARERISRQLQITYAALDKAEGYGDRPSIDSLSQ